MLLKVLTTQVSQPEVKYEVVIDTMRISTVNVSDMGITLPLKMLAPSDPSRFVSFKKKASRRSPRP